MADVNTVIVQGRIVKDAEVKTKNGITYASFSIAMNSQKKVNEEIVQEVQFLNLSIFNKYAENLAPYLIKGQSILVEGYIKTNLWKDKEGNDRKELGIGVKHLHLLSSPKQSEEPKQELVYPEIEEEIIMPTEDEIQDLF